MVVHASEIEDLQKELAKIEAQYKSTKVGINQLNEALKKLVTLQGKVDVQTTNQQTLYDATKKQLDSLGVENSVDPTVVRDKRAALKKQLQNDETLLARYKVLSIAIEDRRRDFQAKSQTLFKQRLLSRGPTIVELLHKAMNRSRN